MQTENFRCVGNSVINGVLKGGKSCLLYMYYSSLHWLFSTRGCLFVDHLLLHILHHNRQVMHYILHVPVGHTASLTLLLELTGGAL